MRTPNATDTKKDFATEPVDLSEAAREVIALTSSELQRRGIVLRPDLAGDLPPVNGDRVQLQQVTLNLLLNASDAMRGRRSSAPVGDSDRAGSERWCAPDSSGCRDRFRTGRGGAALRPLLHDEG